MDNTGSDANCAKSREEGGDLGFQVTFPAPVRETVDPVSIPENGTSFKDLGNRDLLLLYRIFIGGLSRNRGTGQSDTFGREHDRQMIAARL